MGAMVISEEAVLFGGTAGGENDVAVRVKSACADAAGITVRRKIMHRSDRLAVALQRFHGDCDDWDFNMSGYGSNSFDSYQFAKAARRGVVLAKDRRCSVNANAMFGTANHSL